MASMISKAIGALLNDGLNVKRLCAELRHAVKRAPLAMERVESLIGANPLMALPMYEWKIQFRTEEELRKFDQILTALCAEGADEEAE